MHFGCINHYHYFQYCLSTQDTLRHYSSLPQSSSCLVTLEDFVSCNVLWQVYRKRSKIVL